MPDDCNAPTNLGTGDAKKEGVLVACAGQGEEGVYDGTVCDWFAMPSKPGSSGSTERFCCSVPIMTT